MKTAGKNACNFLGRKTLVKCLALACSLMLCLGAWKALNALAPHCEFTAKRFLSGPPTALDRPYFRWRDYGPWDPPNYIWVSSFNARGGRPAEYLGIATDENGFRLDAASLVPAPEKTELWLLGGSIVYGYDLRAPDTMAAFLRRDFAVQVKNLAVPGATSVNGIRVLRKLLQHGQRPGAIVWAFGVNDAVTGPPETMISWALDFGLSWFWNANPAAYFFGVPLRPRAAKEAVPLAKYLAILREVTALSRQYHFGVVITAESFAARKFVESYLGFQELNQLDVRQRREWLANLTFDDQRWRNSLSLGKVLVYQQAARDFCERNQLLYADMSTGIEEEAARTGADVWDFFQTGPRLWSDVEHDPIHPNEAGMTAAASQVEAACSKFGLPLRSAPLEFSYTPRTSSIVGSIPCFNVRTGNEKFLSLAVEVITAGQAVLSPTLYYRTDAGHVLPLIPKDYGHKVTTHMEFSYHDELKNFLWHVSAQASATVEDGAIVLSKDEASKLKPLILRGFIIQILLILPDLGCV